MQFTVEADDAPPNSKRERKRVKIKRSKVRAMCDVMMFNFGEGLTIWVDERAKKSNHVHAGQTPDHSKFRKGHVLKAF